MGRQLLVLLFGGIKRFGSASRRRGPSKILAAIGNFKTLSSLPIDTEIVADAEKPTTKGLARIKLAYSFEGPNQRVMCKFLRHGPIPRNFSYIEVERLLIALDNF